MKKIEREDLNVTIGKPIENTYLYVLNGDKKFNDSNEEGELYTGRMGLRNDI